MLYLKKKSDHSIVVVETNTQAFIDTIVFDTELSPNTVADTHYAVDTESELGDKPNSELMEFVVTCLKAKAQFNLTKSDRFSERQSVH